MKKIECKGVGDNNGFFEVDKGQSPSSPGSVGCDVIPKTTSDMADAFLYGVHVSGGRRAGKTAAMRIASAKNITPNVQVEGSTD